MFFHTPGGDMTSNKLEVLRSTDGVDKVLIKNLTPSDAQESQFVGRNIPAGRCVSRNAAGQSELGCVGTRIPYFQFRGSAQPSTGSVSSRVPVENEPHVTWKSGRDHLVLCYCGLDSIELATTEFIAGTYNLHDFLMAPDLATAGGTPNDLLTKAGVLTNAAPRGGAPQWGADPIVGVVSETAYRTPHRKNMLVFYPLYMPAIQGLKTGTPVNLA